MEELSVSSWGNFKWLKAKSKNNGLQGIERNSGGKLTNLKFSDKTKFSSRYSSKRSIIGY